MSNTVKIKSRTVRRACLGGAAAVGGTALLLTSLPALAEDKEDTTTIQAACEIEQLPGGAETGEGNIINIDGTGNYASGYVFNERFIEAAIWVDGEPITMIDEDHSENQAEAINSDGLAVGYAYFEDTEGSQPFAHVDGETVDMAIPEGYSGANPTDINDDGAIVGYARNSENHEQPFLWESYDAEPTVLSPPEDALYAKAMSISEDGKIAGDYAVEDRTAPKGYVWDTSDSGTALQSDGDVRIDAIEGDWIAGDATELEDTYNTGMRWNGVGAAPEDIDFHYTYDINAQGDVVGNYGSGGTTQRAAKYTADGKLYMLPFPGGRD